MNSHLMSGDGAGFIGVGVLNNTRHRFLFHQPVFLAFFFIRLAKERNVVMFRFDTQTKLDFGTMKYGSLCVIRCPSWCCPSGWVAVFTHIVDIINCVSIFPSLIPEYAQ